MRHPKLTGTRNARRALALIAAGIVASSFTPAHAGISKFYVGPGGLWQNGPWSTSPGGPGNTTTPASTDSAFLNSTTGYTVTTDGGTSIVGLATIQLDSSGANAVGLDNTNGVNVSCTNLILGVDGRASYTSGGGSISTANFVIAQNFTSNGTLTFGNTSLSISSSMTVGSAGFGQFDMSSGSIGVSSNTVPMNVGYSNLGVFNLNGGSVGLGQLIGGVATGGYGIISVNNGTLAVQTATRLGSASGDSTGYAFLNGGTVFFNGSVTVNPGSAMYVQGANFIQSATGSFIVNGGTVELGQTQYFLNGFTGITVNDGYFDAANITTVGGSSIDFHSGTISLNNADFTPATNPIFGTGSVNLTAGKTLMVSGRTTPSGLTPIVINGGTFSTGTLAGNYGNLQFNSGTFRLTADTLVIGDGGIFGAAVTLDSNHRLEAGNGNFATINSEGQLYVTGGALIADGEVDNFGLVQMASPVARVGGGLFNNFNLLAGTGRILAPLLNQNGAEVRVNSGDTLRFDSGGNANGGLLNLNGGYFDFAQDLSNGISGRITGRGTLNTGDLTNDGSIQLSAGRTDVHGSVENQPTGKVIVSGGATATFYDDVTNSAGSEFRVSTNSTAVFFGTVTGLSEFTGPGLKDFEGDTLPGAIVSGGSTLVGPAANVIAQTIRENSLSVEGNLSIVPNGTNAAVSRVSALDISGGSMDLANNALVVDYTTSSPLASIRSLLFSGRAGGTWTGSGLRSSLANATSFALGYAEASQVFSTFDANFLGQSVDNTTVLVRYTRYGDANLDGVVNALDFNALASNFGASGKFWSQGDSNYDGLINSADFVLLSQNFNGTLPAAVVTSVVPEPSTLAFLGACVAILSRRRSHRRR